MLPWRHHCGVKMTFPQVNNNVDSDQKIIMEQNKQLAMIQLKIETFLSRLHRSLLHLRRRLDLLLCF